MPSNPLLPGDDSGTPAMSGAPQAPAPPPSLNELVEGLHKTAYLNAALKDLLSQKKPPTKKDVFAMSSELVEKGVLTPQRIAGELASMPSSEEMLKPWLFTHWLTTENQIEQISQMIEAKGAQEQSGSSPMGQPMIAAPPAQTVNRLLPNGGQ